MALLDLKHLPLVRLRPVANSRNEWVALRMNLGDGEVPVFFGAPDLLAAIAPLDCVLHLDDPARLTPKLLTLLPPQRIVLSFPAGALAQEGRAQRLAALADASYRLLLDGPLPFGMARPAGVRAVSLDCRIGAPLAGSLSAAFGPHLAHGVDSAARLADCMRAGFALFSGDYPLDRSAARPQDATSRRRILGLLALLASDADARELELLLKQDPALSYHLLKLVNSAAFAVNTTITGYAQAIAVLGRRQLQRWLQLLLYARSEADGLPNLLLPLAALRAGQLEMLCRREGGERDAQDLAFMTGAFSLLDRLLGMPMAEILAELPLPAHVTAALLARESVLGQRLALSESGPDAALLASAEVDAAAWWDSQLHAHHWAIQVARNV
ncbi:MULTISPECIES: HDOD domain-containing protein [unclassified Massilia]|uniref:HDOD domain-containing protein n=1 Tax=unclassified Massilia TaxID=2609279 RepID=UPI0017838F8C|nr:MULTISPECIES: HDOD domain-containing protein [unclassified Massilia]MBD8532239.1 HDOD domain-containing protein [Massilia sp. CFBP 13647]MBD8675686.1 HDOD domain-containing protein [Massilia sp. CFBP 13721]